MQVCTSLQTDNHANTSLLSFLQAGCPSCRPTNSVKALKAIFLEQQYFTICQKVKSFLMTTQYATTSPPPLTTHTLVRSEIHFYSLIFT